MAIVVSNIKAVEAPELPAPDLVFLNRLLDIVRQHPHNRMLLFAWVFCAHHLGLSSAELGPHLGCTDRNVRYILAEVRSSQQGEGKTGRPRRLELGEFESPCPPRDASPAVTIGLTRWGGLWLLLPWILSSNLLPYCYWLCSASTCGTPVQFVLTFLALAVCGLGRIWALQDVQDRGFALFTGRLTPLRACQLYTWLKQVGAGAVALFYQATKLEEWRLVRHLPPVLSNDEHVVGHQGGPEMAQGKVSKCGRVMRAHHLFMTFHLVARRFLGLQVTDTRHKLSHVAAPHLKEMVAAYQQVGGDESVFEILDCGSYDKDTHRELLRLHFESGSDYLARIRRTAKNVEQWDRGLDWGEYDLEPYVRGSEWRLPRHRQHRLCLARTTTQITGLAQPLPTLLIIDRDKLSDPDAKTKYAAAFVATADWPAWVQVDTYPWRQDHELAYRDGIHALGLDVKPKGYQKTQPDLPLDDSQQTVEFVSHRIELCAWLRALAHNRVRDLLDHLPDPAPSWTVLTAIRKLIHRTALLQVQGDCFWVVFDPFPGQQVLSAYIAWVNEANFEIPWLGNLKLRLAVADHPVGASLPNTGLRKLLFRPQ